ncbi:MAG: hypothetical protein H7Y41_03380, partial [Hyphomonadaceae bacterium]|nr:hypothetical protein [Clostridia bacterium]
MSLSTIVSIVVALITDIIVLTMIYTPKRKLLTIWLANMVSATIVISLGYYLYTTFHISILSLYLMGCSSLFVYMYLFKNNFTQLAFIYFASWS